MIETLIDAVADSAVGEQRGIAALNRIEQLSSRVEFEECVVLAGERGGRQVLGGSRRMHGHVGMGAVLVLKHAIGGANLGSQIIG